MSEEVSLCPPSLLVSLKGFIEIQAKHKAKLKDLCQQSSPGFTIKDQWGVFTSLKRTMPPATLYCNFHYGTYFRNSVFWVSALLRCVLELAWLCLFFYTLYFYTLASYSSIAVPSKRNTVCVEAFPDNAHFLRNSTSIPRYFISKYIWFIACWNNLFRSIAMHQIKKFHHG